MIKSRCSYKGCKDDCDIALVNYDIQLCWKHWEAYTKDKHKVLGLCGKKVITD